ncbi:SMI1/KNR4 family protein [Burkholderia sp. AU30198]|uniref:SMI1/KNR4 family protein n=1 Tax=Burkholderia sp. AU30198 TaxID=2879627 RepID=UPI001CF44506|nr:SMI1/KNR4 family protein [Burkholderia sp. AU30198]MCA8293731.1 SMI1/KNR4 family protein [Burkholderia sp. AU30198]
MLVENLFGGDGFDFCDQGPSVSAAIVQEVLLGACFNGKDDFVEFYVRNNGGYFNGGAYFYRDVFFDLAPGDFDSMEVEGFYYIGEKYFDESEVNLRSAEKVRGLRAKYSERRDRFCRTHFPFAGDAGDNDFWIDVGTGEVKYVLWESEGDVDDVVSVAPTFSDFVNNIVPRRRTVQLD